MKIRKIYIKNINSLKGEHEIDFMKEPLANAGLFAITGPTGIGKSTILDAICLALYNTVPRFAKVSNTVIQLTGGIMTRGTSESIASVEYESKGKVFQSKWSIALARTGTLKNYEMELADGKGVLMGLNRSQVPAENEKIIGLSYDQFVKSMMLAQGEFSKFIKSNKDERGLLLEKITGTQIYRQLGVKAFEKNREVGQVLDRIEQQIESLKAEIKPEEERKQIKKDLTEKERKIQKLEKEKQELEKMLQDKRKRNDLKNSLAKVETTLEENTKLLNEFKAKYEEKTQKHESVLPFEESIRKVETNRKELSRLKTEIGNNENTLQKLDQDKKSLLEKVYVFLKKQPFEKEIPDELKSVETKVLDLLEHKKIVGSEYNTIWKTAETFVTELGLGITKQLKEEELEGFDELKQKISQGLENSLSKAEVVNPEQIEAAKDENSAKKTVLVNLQNTFSEKRRLQDTLLKQTKEEQEIQQKLKTLPQNFEKLKGETEVLDLSIEQLVIRQKQEALIAKYEIDRGKLEEGSPCFLCGSTHHPFAEHAPKLTDKLEEEILKKTSDQQAKKNDLARIKHEIDTLLENKEKLKGEIESVKNEISTVSEAIEKLSKQFPNIQNEGDIANTEQMLQHELQTLNDLTILFQKNKAILSLEKNLNELRELKLKGSALNEEVSKIYGGQDIRKDVDLLKTNFQNINNSIETKTNDKQEKENAFERVERETTSLMKDLLAGLLEINIRTYEEALDAFLPGKDYSQLKDRKSELTGKIDSSKESIGIYTKQLKEYQHLETVEDLDKVPLQLEEITEYLRNIKIERDELLSSNSIQESALAKLQDLEVKRKAELKNNEKWFLLNKAIGDSMGKKFSTFAQRLTLQHLLGYANTRLSKLSKRYSLAMPDGDKNEDLAVLDHDMGMERRSVKTLSGGESFLVSLSLALGLSDFANKNTNIESLFIDEGFGTLDPDTLEQVLGTLELLQSESNKTIGVISHVELLKERISSKIEVRKAGQGYGKIVVT